MVLPLEELESGKGDNEADGAANGSRAVVEAFRLNRGSLLHERHGGLLCGLGLQEGKSAGFVVGVIVLLANVIAERQLLRSLVILDVVSAGEGEVEDLAEAFEGDTPRVSIKSVLIVADFVRHIIALTSARIFDATLQDGSASA